MSLLCRRAAAEGTSFQLGFWAGNLAFNVFEAFLWSFLEVLGVYVLWSRSFRAHVSRKLASASWSSSCFSKVLGWMDSPIARNFSVNYTPPSLPCPFTSSLVGGSNPAWVSIIASPHSGLDIWHCKLYSPHVNVPFGNWQGMWHVIIISTLISTSSSSSSSSSSSWSPSWPPITCCRCWWCWLPAWMMDYDFFR